MLNYRIARGLFLVLWLSTTFPTADPKHRSIIGYLYPTFVEILYFYTILRNWKKIDRKMVFCPQRVWI